MTHYEVVIHSRGVKDPIVSPETYELEDAEGVLETVRTGIAEREPINLAWFAGSGVSVTAAHIREAEPRQHGEARSAAEILAHLEEIGVVKVTGQLPAPDQTVFVNKLLADHRANPPTEAT